MIQLNGGPLHGKFAAFSMFKFGTEAELAVCVVDTSPKLTTVAIPERPRIRHAIYVIETSKNGTANFERWSDEPAPHTPFGDALFESLGNASDDEILKLMSDLSAAASSPAS